MRRSSQVVLSPLVSLGLLAGVTLALYSINPAIKPEPTVLVSTVPETPPAGEFIVGTNFGNMDFGNTDVFDSNFFAWQRLQFSDAAHLTLEQASNDLTLIAVDAVAVPERSTIALAFLGIVSSSMVWRLRP
jgi:hypothetical protein